LSAAPLKNASTAVFLFRVRGVRVLPPAPLLLLAAPLSALLFSKGDGRLLLLRPGAGLNGRKIVLIRSALPEPRDSTLWLLAPVRCSYIAYIAVTV
jgi:hypothetical protein